MLLNQDHERTEYIELRVHFQDFNKLADIDRGGISGKEECEITKVPQHKARSNKMVDVVACEKNCSKIGSRNANHCFVDSYRFKTLLQKNSVQMVFKSPVYIASGDIQKGFVIFNVNTFENKFSVFVSLFIYLDAHIFYELISLFIIAIKVDIDIAALSVRG